MKITQIDLWHVAIPLAKTFYPSWIPGFPQSENRFTLVRLRTQSGIEGWSAGAAMGREREGLGALLGPYLLGERADDIPSIRQRLREIGYLGQRMGWLEPACWDIIGKARNKPVYELLGGEAGAPIKLYASTGEVKSGWQRIEELEQRRAEGFTAAKLRVHDWTIGEDLAQIRHVARELGGKMKLGIDANQGWRVAVVKDAPRWDYERALDFCREAQELGYDWVEEPLPMDDYEAIARLRAETSIDICGGELNSQGLPEFKTMLRLGCYDVYQPDACFTGGIAETWQIIGLVAAAGARYTPHTWTNGIGFAINLQLHGASPFREQKPLEYPYNPPSWTPTVRDGLLTEPWDHQNGVLRLPTKPGLGFDIDQVALDRYGTHYFRATKLRVALSTVRDKGLKIALEANAARSGRLNARHAELDRRVAGGEDLLRTTLDGTV